MLQSNKQRWPKKSARNLERRADGTVLASRALAAAGRALAAGQAQPTQFRQGKTEERDGGETANDARLEDI